MHAESRMRGRSFIRNGVASRAQARKEEKKKNEEAENQRREREAPTFRVSRAVARQKMQKMREGRIGGGMNRASDLGNPRAWPVVLCLARIDVEGGDGWRRKKE
ncbi:hypothetical protein X777_08575 [Ooceraea biroi]|uniref:Uncharacterized protein n=1 Tax=Ooceraea biroi TaxID=2015173 RepID=A0A026W8K5_OOCBI|nr:hypothetical protein X777_08575 [Ooceraea biroi]